MGYCTKCGKKLHLAHWNDEDHLLCDDCLKKAFQEEFIRYYMGRHEVVILSKGKKKAHIRHREKGYVGNKTEGYKVVNIRDTDIVPYRMLRLNKKN